MIDEILGNMNLTNHTDNPIRAIGYVWSIIGDCEEFHSIYDQVRAITCWAGNRVNTTLVNVVQDSGIYLDDSTRPGFKVLLEAIRAQEIDLIIVSDLTKISRNEGLVVGFGALAHEYGVHIYSLRDRRIYEFENFDSSELASLRKALNVSSFGISQERAYKVQLKRCENKTLLAKDVCYGFSWDPTSKTITIKEAEARIVRWLFDRFVNTDYSLSETVCLLECCGPSISVSQYRSILVNEKYVGVFIINKTRTVQNKKVISLPASEWVRIERPDLKIIDSETFLKAQEKLRSGVRE